MILLVLVVTGVVADGGAHEHHHAEHHGHGDQAVRNAINKLDQQFLYLLSSITSRTSLYHLSFSSLIPHISSNIRIVKYFLYLYTTTCLSELSLHILELLDI